MRLAWCNSSYYIFLSLLQKMVTNPPRNCQPESIILSLFQEYFYKITVLKWKLFLKWKLLLVCCDQNSVVCSFWTGYWGHLMFVISWRIRKPRSEDKELYLISHSVCYCSCACPLIPWKWKQCCMIWASYGLW